MKATDCTSVHFRGHGRSLCWYKLYGSRSGNSRSRPTANSRFQSAPGLAPAKTRPCWCRPCAPSLPIHGLCVFAASHPGCLVGRPRPAPRSCRLPAWLAARALVPPRLLRGPRPPPVSRGKAPRASGPWVTAAPACPHLINTYVDFTEGVGFSGARFPPGEASRDLGSRRATAPVLTRSLPVAVACDRGHPAVLSAHSGRALPGGLRTGRGLGLSTALPREPLLGPLPADLPSRRPLAPAPRRYHLNLSSSE